MRVPLSLDTDKSQFEGLSKQSVIISLKDKWAHPKKRSPLTVFAIGKYWARPLRNGRPYVRTHPMGRPKNLSQKGFCGAFSLKKRPLAPQRPRARRRTTIK